MQVTHLLFIDDLKIYVASEGKLQRVIKSRETEAMMDVGLPWKEKKCAVVHVERMFLGEFRRSEDR